MLGGQAGAQAGQWTGTRSYSGDLPAKDTAAAPVE